MDTLNRKTGLVAQMDRGEYRTQVLSLVEEALEAALDAYEASGNAAPDPLAFASAISDLALPVDQSHPFVELLGPFWSSAKVRAALGINTRQALDSRITSGSILGLPTSDRRLLFPVFQFVAHGEQVRVRPALAGMFSVLRSQDPWSVAVMVNTPAPELHDETPLAWARAGRDEGALVRLARAIEFEWAR
jgi:hypothetical protein